MVPSASIPAVRQNRSKLTETASQALSTAPIPVGGKAVNGVIAFFMALLSFRGISTQSLPAQGEQRRSSYFNIPRGNSRRFVARISGDHFNYSQVLKGAAYMNIADELAVHATEELEHALKISNHVDYLGGMPSVTPQPVKTSDKAEDMLKFDLENEKETIRQYRRRVKQADELNEFAIAESLRGILVEEQDHLIALATALGVDPPDVGIAD